MQVRQFIGFILALLAFSLPLAAQDRATHERQFQRWLQSTVWSDARRAGVSRSVFDAATAGLVIDWKLPGVDLPGTTKSGKQAEFRPPARYFREKTISDLDRIGKRHAARHDRVLKQVENSSGVPWHIVMAIWGRESGYGAVGSSHNAYSVLATRGFFGPNETYFTGELVAAIQLGGGDPVRSSWAGALGQPQMMPTSYLAYGADGNGDGQVDIWDSEADTIASIARFLADHEWVAGRDWGFEINLPSSVPCTLEGPDHARNISEWVALGVTRISGRPFPKHELSAPGYLVQPAGRKGPAFLVTPNFGVLKNYNRSDLYALYVGNLADRIRYGVGGFRAKWQQTDTMTRQQIATAQERLQRQGYDTGGADGLIGHKTRSAIGAWQADNQRKVTCFPNRATLAAIGN